MLPSELESLTVQLPETDRHTIVVVTGNNLRHQRFALRIREVFGDLVTGWYELDSTVPRRWSEKQLNTTSVSHNIQTPSKLKRITHKLIHNLPETLARHSISSLSKRLLRVSIDTYYRLLLRSAGKKFSREETRLFGQEVTRLKKDTTLKPVKIHPDDVHTDGFIEEVQKLDPYFFLTLSGPLYKKPLLDSIRGAAINQHAGHSPLYKGSHTTHWALYHRRLDHVSSTIHITATGADSGHILKRSTPCIFPLDSMETIFLRTVALGTELMIESVEEMMTDKNIQVYVQPSNSGKTYLNKEYNLNIAKSILRDFRAGWLNEELNRVRNY